MPWLFREPFGCAFPSVDEPIWMPRLVGEPYTGLVRVRLLTTEGSDHNQPTHTSSRLTIDADTSVTRIRTCALPPVVCLVSFPLGALRERHARRCRASAPAESDGSACRMRCGSGTRCCRTSTPSSALRIPLASPSCGLSGSTSPRSRPSSPSSTCSCLAPRYSRRRC